jgi:hypothetical protein
MKTSVQFLLLFCNLSIYAQGLDTLTSLNNLQSGQAYYKAPNGKIYKMRVSEADWTDQDTSDIMSLTVNCLDSLYDGKDRKTPKTTFAVGATKIFQSVLHLINFLPKDSVMRKKVKRTTNQRVIEEQKNVRLKKDTYLYAFAKEDDGDYHVIIGDHILMSKATFFNVEISGLPAENPNPKLIAVRKEFERFFEGKCSSKYLSFEDTPIKIDIQGSLFFDVSHVVGQVGPDNMKPLTNWEIHPISKLIFLD